MTYQPPVILIAGMGIESCEDHLPRGSGRGRRSPVELHQAAGCDGESKRPGVLPGKYSEDLLNIFLSATHSLQSHALTMQKFKLMSGRIKKVDAILENVSCIVVGCRLYTHLSTHTFSECTSKKLHVSLASHPRSRQSKAVGRSKERSTTSQGPAAVFADPDPAAARALARF